jgi:hypothetical protein
VIIIPQMRSSRGHIFDLGVRGDPVRITTPNLAFSGFYITDTDRRPARAIVTAELMGDPRPGRSAQDRLEAGRSDL